MKKENKKLAQQKRAKQRKQQKIKNLFEKVYQIGVPVLAFVLLVSFILFDPFAKKATDTSTESSLVIVRDSAFTVNDGDKINIDFVGYIDGEEYEDLNSKGQGTDLTIGSKTYIGDFEQQLIGAHLLDVVDVTVTFPEDYGKEELNGKEALFKVTINGKYFEKEDVPEKELLKDTALEIKKGNTISLDFVGTIDGKEFEGGNTEGQGTDLVVGSGMYIDGFEDQLYGAHPGDTVDVTVTFPTDYGVAELNGKEAVFKVTINGIYQYKIEASE